MGRLGGNKNAPMGEKHPNQFGETLDLLADGMSRARDEKLGMGLPELGEQFNLPAGTGEDEGVVKGEVRDIGQIDRLGAQIKLALGDGFLVEAGLFTQTGHAFGEGRRI